MLHNDDATRLFDALAPFVHLTSEERARIYTACEVQHPAAWADVREVRLDTDGLRPTTLAQVCRWPANPSAETIIAGLHYASGVLT